MIARSLAYAAAAHEASVCLLPLLAPALAASSPAAAARTSRVSPTTTRSTRAREIFNQRCAGCHTLDAAAREGSVDLGRRHRVQGRAELQLSARSSTRTSSTRSRTAASRPARCRRTSSSGEEAKLVACFVATFSGKDAEQEPSPGGATETRRHRRLQRRTAAGSLASDARRQGDPARSGPGAARARAPRADGSDERLRAAAGARRAPPGAAAGGRGAARASRSAGKASAPPRRPARTRRSDRALTALKERRTALEAELQGIEAEYEAALRPSPTRRTRVRRRRGHRAARGRGRRARRAPTTSRSPAG